MNLGRLLIAAGLGIAAVGALILLLNQFNVPLGRLPGDLSWRGKHATVYFPWVTCLLLSALISLLLFWLNRR